MELSRRKEKASLVPAVQYRASVILLLIPFCFPVLNTGVRRACSPHTPNIAKGVVCARSSLFLLDYPNHATEGGQGPSARRLLSILFCSCPCHRRCLPATVAALAHCRPLPTLCTASASPPPTQQPTLVTRGRDRGELPGRALVGVANVLVRVRPGAVEPALAVHALVGVAPEEVALRLWWWWGRRCFGALGVGWGCGGRNGEPVGGVGL